ncbi:MAG TPA: carbonic anhydrase family protein [Gemmataceae bacterium]|nr:carbonic anhydrase family protein [Gemmataceae bacterium]
MPPIAKSAFPAMLLSLVVVPTALAEEAHWGYGKEHGPSQWSEMKPEFEVCRTGTRQSPIDISAAEKADLPAIDFKYQASPLRIINNGHTIQVNLPPGSTITVADHSYALLQFHFHTPSEEAIHGKHHALVAHFVHKDADGKLAVVAVLFDAGKSNAVLAPVLAKMPPEEGPERTVEGTSLDPAKVLPAKRGYYEFEGSLTTPPCSEGVRWFVLKQPVTLSQQQLDAFRKLYPRNARPTQPLNGRVVRESAL